MLSKWKKYRLAITGEMVWPFRTQVVAFIGGAILFLVAWTGLGFTENDLVFVIVGVALMGALMMWNKHHQRRKEIERQVFEQMREWDAKKPDKDE